MNNKTQVLLIFFLALVALPSLATETFEILPEDRLEEGPPRSIEEFPHSVVRTDYSFALPLNGDSQAQHLGILNFRTWLLDSRDVESLNGLPLNNMDLSNRWIFLPFEIEIEFGDSSTVKMGEGNFWSGREVSHIKAELLEYLMARAGLSIRSLGVEYLSQELSSGHYLGMNLLEVDVQESFDFSKGKAPEKNVLILRLHAKFGLGNTTWEDEDFFSEDLDQSVWNAEFGGSISVKLSKKFLISYFIEGETWQPRSNDGVTRNEAIEGIALKVALDRKGNFLLDGSVSHGVIDYVGNEDLGALPYFMGRLGVEVRW